MDLNDLIAKRDALKNIPMSNLSLGEARDRMRELQSIEQAIERAQRQQGSIWHEPSWREQPVGTRFRRAGGAKVSKLKLSEANIGRYIMTVLASVLCLLAFGVFVITIWPYMSDEIRFIWFIGMGYGLIALGICRAKHEIMRPFWLGVAGVGAGLAFIDIIAGSFVWGLYGMFLTIVLILVWFCTNFFMARAGSIGMFYIISYAGGLIALSLGRAVCEYGSPGEYILILAAIVILICGWTAFLKDKSQYLLWCHLIFSELVVPVFISSSGLGLFGDSSNMTVRPGILFGIILSGMCLFAIRYVDDRKSGRLCMLPRVLAGLMASILLCAAVMACPGLGSGLGFALVLIIMAALYYKSASGYLYSILIPAMLMLSGLSARISVQLSAGFGNPESFGPGCCTFLPAFMACLICMIYGYLKSKEQRIAGALACLISIWMCLFWTYPQFEYRAWNVGAVAFLFMAGIAWGVGLWRKNRGFYEPLEWLFVSILPGLLFGVLADLKPGSNYISTPGMLEPAPRVTWRSIDGIVPEIVASVAFFIGLLAYYVLYLRRVEDQDDTPRGLGVIKIIWYVLRVMAYISVMLHCLWPNNFDLAIITIFVMTVLGFHVYRMVKSESLLQSVIACLMANWNLIYLSFLYNMNTQILISIIGMIISAGFIIAGFVLNKKGARQAGLGCCIAYAIKLGLFDIAGVGSLGAAGGLLLAGLICFGVSLAYHKLSQKYDIK